MHTLSKAHHIPFHFHSHHWNMEIVEYYIFQTIFNLGHTMANLFIPIYLHSIGYSLWETALFFLFLQFWFVFILPFAGTAINKLGIKNSILFALFFLFLHALIFPLLSGNFLSDIPLMMLMLFLRGIKGFYGTANDIFLAKHILKKSKGKMLAWVKIVLVLVGILSPLIAGLFIHYYGFESMFYFVSFLYLLSGVPLIMVRNEHFKVEYKAKNILSFSFHKVPKSYLISEAGRIFPDAIMLIMWPLFLFFVLQDTADLGMLVSASAGISMMTSLYIGKKIDSQKSEEKLLKRGVKLITASFFTRAIFLNPLAIAFIDTLNKVIAPIVEIPYQYYVYNMIKKHKNVIEMANVKQFIEEGMYFLAAIPLCIISYFLTEPSALLFMCLFGASSFLLLFMQKITKV